MFATTFIMHSNAVVPGGFSKLLCDQPASNLIRCE